MSAWRGRDIIILPQKSTGFWEETREEEEERLWVRKDKQHPERKEEEAALEEQFSERVGIEQAEMEMIAHSYIAQDEPEEGYTVDVDKTSEKTTRRRRKPAKSKGLSSLFKRGGGSSDKPRAKRRKVTQRATKQR